MSDPTPAALAALDAHWVVWSYEHDAWWASHSRGYVGSLLLAGLYSEEEAKEIEEGANRSRDRKSEEARPLAAALDAQYERWGRRGDMVIDALLAAARQGEEKHALLERQYRNAMQFVFDALDNYDEAEAMRFVKGELAAFAARVEVRPEEVSRG